MNSILTLLGLGAIALYFNNRIKQTESGLNDANKQSQDFVDQIDDLSSQLAVQTSKEESIKQYIKPSIKLAIAEDIKYNPRSFNGYFTITFKNTSSDVPYMIKRVCADISLDGYDLEVYAPGETRSTHLYAGKSVEYHGDYKHEVWFNESSVRDHMRERFEKALSSSNHTLDDMLVANIRAKVNAGGNDHIVVWNEVEGTVKVFSKGSSFDSAGDNALNWEKYDELFEYDE